MERSEAGHPSVVSTEETGGDEEKRETLKEEIRRLEQEIVDHYNRLGKEGEEQVKSSPQRLLAFNRSLTEAFKNSLFRWGCEVRVTCRNVAEATFAWGILNVAVKRAGFLDAEASREYQIELTNGSCIVIKVEDEQ